MNRPVSIYIHVPFCASKCVYCDFASYPDRNADWKAYFDALIAEIYSWREELERCEIQTVFFGGGTPTLVNAEYILRSLDALRLCTRFAENAEITLEGNPGTLNRGKLRQYCSAGVNRLSLGAQALDDRLLKSIGRIHTAADAVSAVKMAQDSGFVNLNLDLIYALPGQTIDDWYHTLEMAIALRPAHLSAYSLIVEPGTPMFDRVARGECAVPDEDTCINMQRTANRILAANGYARYEISNYARPNAECRHNLAYWRRQEYLGFGCAAHSMFGDRRFENPRGLDAYLSGARRLNEERLTREGEIEETLMLGTRLCEGVDLEKWAQTFGFRLEERYLQTLERFERAGLARIANGRLQLTERGMEVQDAIVVALLE
ncbi:MAG: radical SAM family heme chaperone HemW [Candidatus Faecivicinus sp.]|nr:radical SAM family heme chaperone HemW [Candidatus Faecivicinus sp.]